MFRRLWTEDEISELRRRYPNERSDAIAADMGRPVGSIYGKAQGLGLKKSDEFFADTELSGRTDGNQGQSSRFKKGQQSWNKGNKGYDAGGRSHETRFQAGHKPHNWVPVGSERVASDGIRQRKVSDTGYPPRDWKSVHMLLWIEAHGEVPKNHIVVFKDGNRENICLDNLECISRGELMRRNTIHNLPEEMVGVIRMRGALNRQINKREKA